MRMPPAIKDLFGFSRRAARTLDSANAARDQKDWQSAAGLYAKYLVLKPEAADIWVQYGHALKESGSRNQAKDAYEKALSLEGSNADTYLQMGHLLKVMGDRDGAIAQYKRSLGLMPSQPDAANELRSLGLSESKLNEVRKGLDIATPSSAAPNDSIREVERRIGVLSTQFERVLAFMSDAKALHFELLNCKRELSDLRAEFSARQTAADQKVASRMEGAESQIRPLTEQLGRLDAQLADTKALMHLEMTRRSKEVQELERETDSRLAQANGEVSGLSARLAGLEQRTDESSGRLVGDVTVLKETTAAYASTLAFYASSLDRHGGVLEDQRQEAGTLRTIVERQEEELITLKNHARGLAAQLAGLEKRTDEPLARVLGEVAVLKETAAAYASTLAAYASSLDRHGSALEAQREDVGTLRATMERQEAELARLAARLADIGKEANEPIEQVTSQLKEVTRDVDAHSAELASIGHQLVIHVAKMADLRKICSDLEIGANTTSSVSGRDDALPVSDVSKRPKRARKAEPVNAT